MPSCCLARPEIWRTRRPSAALYAMVRRGHLKEPVIGVALEDWSVDQLRERARDGIELSEGARRRQGLRASSPSCSAM